MEGIKDYADYVSYFNDDLVVAVRKVLKRIEDRGAHDLEDSKEHNALKSIFNKFALHNKITPKEYETWK